MSAWSDYKCGAITYDEYRFECMEEVMLDEYDDQKEDEEED